MESDKNKSHLLKRIILHCARLPLVYLILGIFFISVSLIDNVFNFIQWKNIFDITEIIGHIFIVLAFITFIYNFFVLICLHFEQKLVSTDKMMALILTSVRRSSRIIFILVAISLIITYALPIQAISAIANNVIYIIIVACISWVAIQILYTIEAVVYQYMVTLTTEEHIRGKVLYTKIRIARNIATVVIILVTIAAILMSFESVRNIGISLLASAGFLTVVVGLAAQKTLFSLFSGIQLAFFQPIKIGDMVLIEKETGIVEEITFSYITLKLGDRRRLVVPITYFIEKPFENWSRESGSMRSSIHFNVDFMMPIEPLRKQLDAILTQSKLWDGHAKKVQVCNLTDKSVEIRLQISAANADNLADLKAEVREKILNFMQENYPNYFPNARTVSANHSQE